MRKEKNGGEKIPLKQLKEKIKTKTEEMEAGYDALVELKPKEEN